MVLYAPNLAVKIVNSCAVLHNIAIVTRMPEPAEQHVAQDDMREIATEQHFDHNVDNLQQGRQTQRELVETL